MSTREQVARVAANNIATKFFQLQLEYMGPRRIRVTVCNIPAFIAGEVLAFFLSAYGRESSLIDFLAEFDLIDRFHLDHPRREMWMWMGNLPSGQVQTYLDRVFVRRADVDFISCPTFHWTGLADHKLVRVSLRRVNRASLASYWKFNTSLLEIRDFRETLIQQALVRAVTGNR